MVRPSTTNVAAAAALLSILPSAVYCHAHEGVGFHISPLERRENEPHLKVLRERFGPVAARVQADDNHGFRKRQTTSSASSSSTSSASAASSSNAATTSSLSSGTIPIGTTTTQEVTSPLPTTYSAGATSPVSGAPVLPAVVITPSEWPTLDKTPSINSTEVQQWISEIDWTQVPDIAVNGIGGCQNTSANAQAITDAATNGWWTCGWHTRSSDIVACPDKNTWGLSYDDGPSPDTPRLLNYMVEHDLKSTFFIVGSRAISRPEMLQYEYLAGNQLSVHTWAHPYLTTKTNEEIVAELGWTKKALKTITGVTPNTMRPPYGDIDDRVRAISLQMGLTPIIWTTTNGTTYDTQDWQVAGGVVNADTVVEKFETIIDNAGSLDTGFIVLEHDLYQQSTSLAVDYVLPFALNKTELKLMPIYQCLGQSLSDVYIETASNTTGAAVSSTVDRDSSATVQALGDNGSAQTSTSSSGSGSGSGAASHLFSPAASSLAGLAMLAALAAML